MNLSGVARGDPPQTPIKSIEAKLKSNEAKPSSLKAEDQSKTLYMCSTKTLEVLGNPSLKPEGNLEGGVDQKIFPCGQGRIDSVKINPSLLMMREFTFPCPDPALEASIRWCYTVAMCYSRVTRCYILRTTQNRQQNLLGILDSHLPLIQLGD